VQELLGPQVRRDKSDLPDSAKKEKRVRPEFRDLQERQVPLELPEPQVSPVNQDRPEKTETMENIQPSVLLGRGVLTQMFSLTTEGLLVEIRI
jgi:hypothetical protein